MKQGLASAILSSEKKWFFATWAGRWWRPWQASVWRHQICIPTLNVPGKLWYQKICNMQNWAFICLNLDLSHAPPLLKNRLFICKSRGPQSYFRTLFWILWTFHASFRKKLWCVFDSFAVLENTCFVCNSMGNEPVEGTITSILKH